MVDDLQANIFTNGPWSFTYLSLFHVRVLTIFGIVEDKPGQTAVRNGRERVIVNRLPVFSFTYEVPTVTYQSYYGTREFRFKSVPPPSHYSL